MMFPNQWVGLVFFGQDFYILKGSHLTNVKSEIIYLTIGSSLFLWNWTSRTRLILHPGSISTSGLGGCEVSPFMLTNVWIGGGVTRTASSLYTSWATTSCACNKAYKLRKGRKKNIMNNYMKVKYNLSLLPQVEKIIMGVAALIITSF